jgi:hypothetical protein
MQQSIMFQKKNRIQYIEFLEKKYKSLILENKNLKKYNEMLMNNNLNNNENINNMNKNIANNKNINNYYSNNNNKQNYYNKNNNVNYNIEGNNNIYKTPNVTDRKSNLKKIQVKKSDAYQNSIKYSPYISRYDENLNNVKNLNAQTAFEQQYSIKQGNNINVNINDDNSARRTTSSFMNNLSTKRSSNSIEKIIINKILENIDINYFYFFLIN